MRAFIEVLERWAEGEPDEVMARRAEQISAVCRIYIEKDAGDDNRLLFEKFLEERKTIVDRVGEILQVEPYVKRCDRRNRDLKPDGLQAL